MLFSDLCNKEVVSVTTGIRLGQVDDVEIDDDTAEVKRVYIYARGFFGGMFAREGDVVIEWEDIDTIGPDLIMVKNEKERISHPRKKPR
jgi:sporulation protein, YlmC/YmxH family